MSNLLILLLVLVLLGITFFLIPKKHRGTPLLLLAIFGMGAVFWMGAVFFGLAAAGLYWTSADAIPEQTLPMLVTDSSHHYGSHDIRRLSIDGQHLVDTAQDVPTLVTAEETGITSHQRGDHDSRLPLIAGGQYRYSPSDPLRADVYPSITSCGRPLAFQLANDIRDSGQFSTKTAFEIEIIREEQSNKDRPNEVTHSSSMDSCIAYFQNELMTQFPGSSVWIAAEAAGATEATSEGFKKLDIRLSHRDPKNDKSSGSLQANWTINDKASAKTSVKYIEKQWVNSLMSQSFRHRDENTFAVSYERQSYRPNMVIGFTNRFARSPREASKLAMQNAMDFYERSHRSFSCSVIDSFQQKLSMPYGELWQEAVLVDFIDKTASTTAVPATQAVSVTRTSSKRTFLLILLIGGLVLLVTICSYVVKRYQLPPSLLVVPCGLIVCLATLFIMFIKHRAVRDVAVRDVAVRNVAVGGFAGDGVVSGVTVVESRDSSEASDALLAEAEYRDSASDVAADTVEHSSTRHESRLGHVSNRPLKKRPAWLFLIILMAGTFGVAWISNMLTQGYYRRTINSTLVTAIAVIVALILLALFIS